MRQKTTLGSASHQQAHNVHHSLPSCRRRKMGRAPYQNRFWGEMVRRHGRKMHNMAKWPKTASISLNIGVQAWGGGHLKNRAGGRGRSEMAGGAAQGREAGPTWFRSCFAFFAFAFPRLRVIFLHFAAFPKPGVVFCHCFCISLDSDRVCHLHRLPEKTTRT